jgi:photosystem II stability/assembly factor-like uncharacterized protein
MKENEQERVMNGKFRILIIACVAVAAFAGGAIASDWIKVHGGQAQEGELYRISAIDKYDVFFSGSAYDDGIFNQDHQMVFYSHDSGVTLTPVYFLETGISGQGICNSMVEVNDIHFDSATEGYLAGVTTSGTGLFECTGNMTSWVAKTTDGGYTWTDAPITPKPPAGIFYNPLRGLGMLGNAGYAVGEADVIYRTVDGGANWAKTPNAPSPYGSSADLNDVSLYSTSNVWVAGYDIDTTSDDDDDTWDDEDFEGAEDAQAFGSVNSGQNWSLLFNHADSGFPSIFFIDASHGWLTQAGLGVSNIFYTDNGGTSWGTAQLPTNAGGIGAPGTDYMVIDVAMVNTLDGWAVGYNIATSQSVVLYTADGGRNWDFDDYLGLGELYAIHMVNPYYGYASGRNMTVLYFDGDDDDDDDDNDTSDDDDDTGDDDDDTGDDDDTTDDDDDDTGDDDDAVDDDDDVGEIDDDDDTADDDDASSEDDDFPEDSGKGRVSGGKDCGA